MRNVKCFSLLVAVVLIACQPTMTEHEYNRFAIDSSEYLNAKQKEMMAHFKIGSYHHFDWNQDTATIIFSEHGVPKVVADIQLVGDVSKTSKTWLWSWANSTADARVKNQILLVKRYGIDHGIHKLTSAEWPADQAAGWEMTAIAARILNASGAYRTEERNGYTFMILKNIRWADSSLKIDHSGDSE